MSTTDKHAGAQGAYRQHLFQGLALYTTRLVREGDFPFNQREQFSTPDAVADLLFDYFRERDREEFLIVLLDTSNSVIGISRVSIGGLAASIVEPRQVFKTAILSNAAAVIAAHNHITGNPEPSREDIRLTRQLIEAGKLMGVPLLDHLIILDDGYTSLAERGLMG